MRTDAQNNRHKILQVANQLFSQSDAHDVTMAQIAKAAHVGVGTLYRNFPTKGDLFLALAYDQLDQYIQEQQKYLADHKIDREAIRHVLVGYLKFREHRMSLFTKSTLEGIQRYYQRDDYQKLVDLFSKLIHVANPKLGQTELTFRADMLIAFLRNDSYLLQRKERHLTPDQILEQIMEIFFS